MIFKKQILKTNCWIFYWIVNRTACEYIGHQRKLRKLSHSAICILLTALRMAKNGEPDYDQLGADGECKVKIICLGDSAVGKSK